LQQRFLDQVVGVRQAARPPRQAAAGPSLQRFQVSSEEGLNRILISVSSSIDQLECGIQAAGTCAFPGAETGALVDHETPREL
jgi:hypothetical protein